MLRFRRNPLSCKSLWDSFSSSNITWSSGSHLQTGIWPFLSLTSPIMHFKFTISKCPSFEKLFEQQIRILFLFWLKFQTQSFNVWCDILFHSYWHSVLITSTSTTYSIVPWVIHLPSRCLNQSGKIPAASKSLQMMTSTRVAFEWQHSLINLNSFYQEWSTTLQRWCGHKVQPDTQFV